MKLQIKTLNQKTLLIDIDEDKTVYDLKQELSMYPDVAAKPPLQKLIYAGQILKDELTLKEYNIDTKKILVVMILKQPEPEPKLEPPAEPPKAAEASLGDVKDEQSKDDNKTPQKSGPSTSTASTIKQEEFKTPDPPGQGSSTAVAPFGEGADRTVESLVEQIMAMGYPEPQVRKALAASFYNPERAIEYLIEGIPTSPSSPEGNSQFMDSSGVEVDNTLDEVSPYEMFRTHPLFHALRAQLHDNPNFLSQAVQNIGQANPELLEILELIDENPEEFLAMMEAEDDADDPDEDLD